MIRLRRLSYSTKTNAKNILVKPWHKQSYNVVVLSSHYLELRWLIRNVFLNQNPKKINTSLVAIKLPTFQENWISFDFSTKDLSKLGLSRFLLTQYKASRGDQSIILNQKVMESIEQLTDIASSKRDEEATSDSTIPCNSEGQTLSWLNQSDKLVSQCEINKSNCEEMQEENNSSHITASIDQGSSVLAQEPEENNSSHITASIDQGSSVLAQEPEESNSSQIKASIDHGSSVLGSEPVEPSDSLSLQEDNELLVPLIDHVRLNSPTCETKVCDFDTNAQSERVKTKKQARRKRQKMKRRKPGNYHSSEHEEVYENTTNTTDENKEGIDNDSNSEDGSIPVKKGLCDKRKLKKKRKKQGVENESDKDESSDHEVTPKKPIPNYFVAVRVSNPLIHSAVKVIQDSIVNHDAAYQPALIPISTLHITLMVMHLEAHEVDKAVEVLQMCKSDLINLFDKDETLSMTFEGLAHFRNEVLFVKINEEDEVEKLKLLASVVSDNYEKHGIPKTDDRPFNPHLTILKLSRMKKKKKKRIKKIPSESYSAWLECELGKETISEVLLCSMTHKKDEEGFYHCVGSVDIHH